MAFKMKGFPKIYNTPVKQVGLGAPGTGPGTGGGTMDPLPAAAPLGTTPMMKSPMKQVKEGTYKTSTEEHAKENPYWYKINGKKVSKHIYVNYEVDPAKDEIGKQTNDPDAYGYIAEREEVRSKLTETKLKDE